MKSFCKHMKADGTRCRGRRIQSSQFCWFHDPARAKERRSAQRRGHANSVCPRPQTVTLPANTPDVKVETAHDVVGLLSHTVNQVRRGQLDVRVANSVAYICGYILKAREQGEIEDRLVKVEDAVKSVEVR